MRGVFASLTAFSLTILSATLAATIAGSRDAGAVSTFTGKAIQGGKVDASPCLQRVAFFTIQDSTEMLAQFANFAEADLATFRFQKNDERGGKCSATFTSSEGHFLTAFHCLMDCLVKEGAYRPYDEAHPEFKYYLAVPDKIKKSSCKASIGGDDFLKQEIAGFPKEFVDPDSKNLDLFEKKRPEMIDYFLKNKLIFSNDYLLIKAHQGKKPIARSCVHVSREHVEPWDATWSLPYPMETKRARGMNTDGKSKYAVFGNAVDAPTDPDHPETFKYLQEDSLFFSTMDGVCGSSGSGVMKSDGSFAMVGMTTVVVGYDGKCNSTQEAYGATGVLRMETVLGQLEKTMPPDEFKKAFDCKAGP